MLEKFQKLSDCERSRCSLFRKVSFCASCTASLGLVFSRYFSSVSISAIWSLMSWVSYCSSFSHWHCELVNPASLTKQVLQ